MFLAAQTFSVKLWYNVALFTGNLEFHQRVASRIGINQRILSRFVIPVATRFYVKSRKVGVDNLI